MKYLLDGGVGLLPSGANIRRETRNDYGCESTCPRSRYPAAAAQAGVASPGRGDVVMTRLRIHLPTLAVPGPPPPKPASPVPAAATSS